MLAAARRRGPDAAHRPAPLQHPLARAAHESGRARPVPQRCCEGADHGRRRPARLGPRAACSATSSACSLQPRASSTSPTRPRSSARSPRSSPTSSSTAPRSTTSRSARARRTRPWRINVERRQATSRARAARSSSTSRPTTSSTARRDEPYGEDDLPVARSPSTRSPSSPASTRRSPTRRARWSCAPPASTGSTAAPRRAATSCTRMIARAREQGALEDGRRPAPAADLHRRPRRGDDRGGRGRAPTGVAPPDRRRARAPGSSSPRRSWSWPGSTCPIEPVRDHDPAGRRRPAAERRARPAAADALGLTPLRPWRDGARRLHGAGRSGRAPAAIIRARWSMHEDWRPGSTGRS